jgi:hypothetical protein
MIFFVKSKFELQVNGIIEFSRSKNDIHAFECIVRRYQKHAIKSMNIIIPGTRLRHSA